MPVHMYITAMAKQDQPVPLKLLFTLLLGRLLLLLPSQLPCCCCCCCGLRPCFVKSLAETNRQMAAGTAAQQDSRKTSFS